jgi:hypothetical protein
MSDNPLDRIPSFDRVSVRAVVVMEGEDPGPMLAAAGIVDAVAVPVVFGESAPDRGFGDGFTPNISAVMEFDQEAGGFEAEADEPEDGATRSAVAEALASRPGTVTLPAAYGIKPLAPVRSAD